jgi:hypothetical protein
MCVLTNSRAQMTAASSMVASSLSIISIAESVMGHIYSYLTTRSHASASITCQTLYRIACRLPNAGPFQMRCSLETIMGSIDDDIKSNAIRQTPKYRIKYQSIPKTVDDTSGKIRRIYRPHTLHISRTYKGSDPLLCRVLSLSSLRHLRLSVSTSQTSWLRTYTPPIGGIQLLSLHLDGLISVDPSYLPSTLKSLTMGSIKMVDMGYLPTGLTSLTLLSIDQDPSGGHFDAFLALCQLPLVSLSVATGLILNEWRTDMMTEHMKQLQQLSISSGDTTDLHSYRSLMTLQKLTSLELRMACARTSIDDLLTLNGNRSLRSLSIIDSAPFHQCLPPLATLTSLFHLKLCARPLLGAALAAHQLNPTTAPLTELDHLVSLQSLTIRIPQRCYNWPSLTSLINLTSLTFVRMPITSEMLTAMLPSPRSSATPTTSSSSSSDMSVVEPTPTPTPSRLPFFQRAELKESSNDNEKGRMLALKRFQFQHCELGAYTYTATVFDRLPHLVDYRLLGWGSFGDGASSASDVGWLNRLSQMTQLKRLYLPEFHLMPSHAARLVNEAPTTLTKLVCWITDDRYRAGLREAMAPIRLRGGLVVIQTIEKVHTVNYAIR